jgi:hypothetical protein
MRVEQEEFLAASKSGLFAIVANGTADSLRDHRAAFSKTGS